MRLKDVRNPNRALNHMDLLVGKNKEIYRSTFSKFKSKIILQTARLEVHPTDTCNLACYNCCSKQDLPSLKPKQTSYPFRYLYKLKMFNPRAIVISGGGEPTLYRSGNKFFNNYIQELKRIFPNAILGITTNGTIIPKGAWENYFKWLRISLDAANRETYRSLKGRDCFEKVLKNFDWYVMNTNIQEVGIGFLYSKNNINEAFEVSKLIFERCLLKYPNQISKINIQYRPLRKDFCNSRKCFKDAISVKDAENEIEKFNNEFKLNKVYKNFVQENTNYQDILKGNFNKQIGFHYCSYSKISVLVKANGNIRPCCIGQDREELAMGNCIKDSRNILAQKMLKFHSSLPLLCSKNTCRYNKINALLEKSSSTVISKSNFSRIKNDPMF